MQIDNQQLSAYIRKKNKKLWQELIMVFWVVLMAMSVL